MNKHSDIMHDFEFIYSKDNQLIKQVVNLAKNSKYRHQLKLAVIYGEHLVIEALAHGYLRTLFIMDGTQNKYKLLIDKMDPRQVKLLLPKLMNKLNILSSPATIIGLMTIPIPQINPQIYHDDCLILEEIQDPGNLGTILRCAKASGLHNILLSKGSVDIYNPKVLRAAQGLHLGLNLYTDINLQEFINQYSGKILALNPQAASSIYQEDLTKKHCFILGNEGGGLSLDMRKNYLNMKIPMAQNTESLNVAMAATIVLFECQRQRLVNAT